MPETRDHDAPVFVVGISRSGTTLLSAMLSAHPRLDCGPESHLLTALGTLEPAERKRLLDPATWPRPAAEFVAGHEHGDHPTTELFGLSADDISSWLADREPSVAAMLESLTMQHAQCAGAARWVEKTPRHLLELPVIREAWPDAYIVRIVRDPRDVAISLTRVPFGADTQLGNLVRIDHDDRRSRGFFRSDPRTMTLRYEDLVTEPEPELRRICELIGEEFAPAMLDRSDSAVAVTAEHEWWKASVSGPLQTSSIGRWHEGMPGDVQRFASLYLADYLEAHGYEGAVQPEASVALVPIGDLVSSRDERLLLALAAEGLTPVRPSPRWASDLRRRAGILFVGVRGQLDPVRSRGFLARARNTLGLSRVLLRRRLRGEPVLWLREPSDRSRKSDLPEAVLALLLRLLARSVDREEAPALLARTALARAAEAPDA